LESAFSKIIIMEVTGKIRVVGAEQQVSATFKKRELVVTTEEQYPQYISITFVQDKCDLLNNYNVGDAVKVSINLRGREWVNPQGETKYFNDIQGWRIEKLQAEAPAQMPPMPAAEAFAPATNFNEEEHDDLPF
jgi:translation initiation factor IF-3